ncbi:MAG: virulence RhuM family protein [Methanomassiliicoccaceae archaeon]|nr:virulence RhuM family protein [Methanomassiliicoccaceae archaeon]
MSEKKKNVVIRNGVAEFLIFSYQSNGEGIEVRVQDGTVWLSQKQIGMLFGCSPDNVGLHLRKIYAEAELDETATTEDFSVAQTEGARNVTRSIAHYSLDAIIAVGYRVSSERAMEFRRWATAVLRDYALRGYVLDKKRMENGAFLDDDYFERLLEEIREIRLSERRFYQKVTDIYATSLDYDKDSPRTRDFFAKVQNKMHYAVHGNTAAELVYGRADAGKEHMGPTSLDKALDGRILEPDATVAENHMAEREPESLGMLVNAYLDFAERRAMSRMPMTMEAWAEHMDPA